MVQNDGVEVDDNRDFPATETTRGMPVGLPVDQEALLAEAQKWLAVIPPDAACYRLLQLGILRRDTSLLEGLLSVLRST
jgi:hypothetical protein